MRAVAADGQNEVGRHLEASDVAVEELGIDGDLGVRLRREVFRGQHVDRRIDDVAADVVDARCGLGVRQHHRADARRRVESRPRSKTARPAVVPDDDWRFGSNEPAKANRQRRAAGRTKRMPHRRHGGGERRVDQSEIRR